MATVRFVNGNVVTDAGVLPAAELRVAGDRIEAIVPLGDDATRAIDLRGGWVVPGFIDVQVNGGGGALLNDMPTVEGIRRIAAAHARSGTTALLPTLITDTPANIERALDAVDAAIVADVPGVVGIHVEGPVLNPARRGIHDASLFRDLDEELFAILARPRRGRVMVTLAPERVDPATIARLVAADVVVSAGHCAPDAATMRAAIDAGLSGVTHLFNAMPPMEQRVPGIVGTVLDDPRPWCGLIADGLHVDPIVLRTAIRARPADRTMLVSDAMTPTGTAMTHFMLQGRPIRVEAGRYVHADGTLAGADLDMARAFANAVTQLGVSPAQASAMTAANPAAFLRLSHERGRLAPGLRADWVVLDADFAVVDTHIAPVGGTDS